MDEAMRLGAEIVLNAKVSDIDLHGGAVSVEDGTVYTSDVVVGADGEYMPREPTALDGPWDIDTSPY
jgi:flavin-dependent dehydrogenase